MNYECVINLHWQSQMSHNLTAHNEIILNKFIYHRKISPIHSFVHILYANIYLWQRILWRAHIMNANIKISIFIALSKPFMETRSLHIFHHFISFWWRYRFEYYIALLAAQWKVCLLWIFLVCVFWDLTFDVLIEILM